jgi:hypothetical protein
MEDLSTTDQAFLVNMLEDVENEGRYYPTEKRVWKVLKRRLIESDE